MRPNGPVKGPVIWTRKVPSTLAQDYHDPYLEGEREPVKRAYP